MSLNTFKPQVLPSSISVGQLALSVPQAPTVIPTPKDVVIIDMMLRKWHLSFITSSVERSSADDQENF